MEPNQSKTPYNSIYAELKKTNTEGNLVCCAHGKECDVVRGKAAVKPDENQYVNLNSSPRKGKSGKLSKEYQMAMLENQEPERKTKPELVSLSTFIEQNIPEASKKKKKDKKKRTPTLVNDDQSYVMLGNTSDDVTSQGSQSQVSTVSSLPHYQSSAPPPTEVTVIETAKSIPKAKGSIPGYMGTSTYAVAESRVKRRGEFGLYHLFSPEGRLDTLPETLPLMIMYRTTTKKARHYPIRTTADSRFYVDCGYPSIRKHFSLEQLVLYYKSSASSEINPNDTSADSFSWWLE